jgi:hypothetical protein
MMEVEEPDFKEIIIPKIKKSTQDLVNNKHSRVHLGDFNSIQKKKVGHYFAFFNKVYKNVSKSNYLIFTETIRFF